ncbi:MAG: hypothetical protein IH820_12455 [Bacteroidetes bacterium]|nr:hypothetical protein [Bacteroidota bacterium]
MTPARVNRRIQSLPLPRHAFVTGRARGHLVSVTEVRLLRFVANPLENRCRGRLGLEGNELDPVRSEIARWDVAGHDGIVRFTYKVFGDRVDGTYLGIDVTHAHLNMPASLMWGVGLERRPATVRFEPPAGRDWQVATQLYPSDDPLTFTAPTEPGDYPYVCTFPGHWRTMQGVMQVVASPSAP